MSGATPAGSPEGDEDETRRKLDMLMPQRRVPEGARAEDMEDKDMEEFSNNRLIERWACASLFPNLSTVCSTSPTSEPWLGVPG